ncbi:Hcp family type VI secretion system effector [Limnobacter sp.]|uniref:Hcp family type VI secretion system effector n=1 Tax=Limnobacter sp. TaxID=2003368 RepID=UPI003002A367
MKVDMFLKIGDVKGDSVDAKHKGEIELIRAKWGISLSSTNQTGRGGCAGRPELQALSITKYVDRSSPVLHALCCAGMQFEQAVLVKRKSGAVPLEYFKFTMKDVVISNVSMHLGESDQLDQETITLSFAEYVEEFIPQNADGSGGAAVRHGFNVAKNLKL